MLYPSFRLCRPARSPASCSPPARKKRGFNLIEAAIVLGVVGLVIGGIWYAAASVRQKLLIDETARGIIAMCDQLTNFYRSMPTEPVTNETLTSVLLKTDILPPSWSRSGLVFTPLNTDSASSTLQVVRYADASAVPSEGIQPGDIGLHLLIIPKAYCPTLLSTLNAKSNSALSSVTIGTGWWTTSTTFLLPNSGDISAPCKDGDLLHLRFMCKRK